MAAHRRTQADLWEAFCSLPKAHDHHLVHHVHVFTDGSVDFDEAQSSSPFPPSALSAGFSGVVSVACGKELLFLGALWSPLFQQFSQCKNPSASQAEFAAVAGTLKFFGNTLARHRVGLTIHADCLFAIQATKGLCSSKTCSALTDLTRKDFVLLSQHILIDIIHVSAHQGDIDNEFADFFANMAHTCVASHSPSEWPHRRLDFTLLVSDDLVAESFWTLVERCHDPMCSRSFVSPANKRVTIVTANVLTMHLAQVPDSDPDLFSARRLQLSLGFEGKMAHLVGVQESRCRETSVRSFRGYTILSSAATARSVWWWVVGLFEHCDRKRY